MERSSRLRKYHRKDYTQSVDFPVEIVGRDGRVRRYSYDESVRLYQRRVRSAIARLDDAELVDAEVRHCRLRIEQLRRSYLEQQGQAVGDGRVVGTILGAELYAFLARQGLEAPDLGTMKLVSSGIGDVVWLKGQGGRSFMVYVWRLDSRPAQIAFQQQRVLLGVPSTSEGSGPTTSEGDGVERLFVAYQTAEVGILLSGEGSWDRPAIDTGPAEGELEVVDGPVEVVAMRALKDGNIADALRVFEEGMEASPLRPGLALATAAVALLDQQVDRARFAAVFGLLHATQGDATRPLLTAMLGVSLFRLGQPAAARQVLKDSLGVPLGRAVSILVDLTQLRPWGLLSVGVSDGPGARALMWTRSWGLRWCGAGLALACALLTAALLAAPVFPVVAAFTALLGLAAPALVLARLAAAAGRILRAAEEPGLLLGMELLGAKGR